MQALNLFSSRLRHRAEPCSLIFGSWVVVQRSAVAPRALAFSGHQLLSGACPSLTSGYCNGKTLFPPGELFLGCSEGNAGPGGPLGSGHAEWGGGSTVEGIALL